MRRSSFAAATLAAGLAVMAPAVSANAAGVIPADGTTVYTLEPLNYNLVLSTPNTLQGKMCSTTHPCVKVPTSASLDLTHKAGVIGEPGPIFRAAQTLDQMLRDDSDQDTVVFGYSQGGQIIAFWLRNYAAQAGDYATKDSTRFLSIGNPENTYGVPWAPRVPTTTGYDVTEMWAQYDGWADWPVRFDLLALANAVYGMLFVHPKIYDNLDPESADVITWTDGSMTYKMAPSAGLPILDPLRRIGFGWLADMVNAPLQAQVESAYDRPTTQAEADALSEANAARHAAATPPATMPAALASPLDEAPPEPSAKARATPATAVANTASLGSDVADDTLDATVGRESEPAAVTDHSSDEPLTSGKPVRVGDETTAADSEVAPTSPVTSPGTETSASVPSVSHDAPAGGTP